MERISESPEPRTRPSRTRARRPVSRAPRRRRDPGRGGTGDRRTGLQADRRPDPMYLTQMGTIPLLTREQEIGLAKKIETTHVLPSHDAGATAARQAVEILHQVHEDGFPSIAPCGSPRRRTTPRRRSRVGPLQQRPCGDCSIQRGVLGEAGGSRLHRRGGRAQARWAATGDTLLRNAACEPDGSSR